MLFSYSVVVESHEHYKQHNIVDIIIFLFRTYCSGKYILQETFEERVTS